MKYIVIILLSTFLVGFSYFVVTHDDVVRLYQHTSSPVEEMYHRVLVNTLDSILDARFGTGCCCEEDIDTVSTNTFRTHVGSMLSPMY